MSTAAEALTNRERELGAIIAAYNEVTEQLKVSHERLRDEVRRLRQELARKNAELRRRDRLAALGEMAAGVAHEIRNPLGGIQVFASLLARDLADRPSERQLAEKITKCVGALEDIVADILEFGRPSDATPSRVALGELIRETVELASSRGNHAGVAVRVAGGADEIDLMVDAALLKRALLNLVVNAIQAAASADKNGAVEIRAAAESGGQISIQIRDDGPGIPSELMDRIFNPFFTTKDTGTGLGLAIVHQIAETLEGSIRAANRKEGGAVFTLRIPAGAVDAHDVTEGSGQCALSRTDGEQSALPIGRSEV